MDAKTFVSLLIQKLEELLSKEAIKANPRFVDEVRKANKHLQERRQSLQDSEDQNDVLSVLPAVYSAKDIIDSLLKRKEFQLQPTRKGKIKNFKKMVQHPFMCFKSSHSQDTFTLQLEKLRNEISALSSSHDHLVEKKETETANTIDDVLIGFSNDATSSYFLNEEGRQRWQQLWERRCADYLNYEENFVGQEQIDKLVALLKIPKERSIPKTKRSSDMPSTHDQSSEGTGKNTAEEDGDQCTKANAEDGAHGSETNVGGVEQRNCDPPCSHDHSSEGIEKNIIAAEQDSDQSTKVSAEGGNGASGKTVYNHGDCKNSDRDASDDKSRISPRDTSEGGQSIYPAQILSGRFLKKKVITLLQFLIDFFDDEESNGDRVPEQDGHHSTIEVTTVAGDEILEKAPGQESNDSSNQVTAVNAVAGERDSGISTRNHCDHQPLVPHPSDDHPSGEIVEEVPERDSSHHPSNQVTAGAREETDRQSSDEIDEVYERGSNHSTNQVIAVVGKAGSGKSTLARTVYNRIDVKRHFTERAWVRVSSQSEAKDVLLGILTQTKQGLPNYEMEETLSEEELMYHLKERLKNKNYLIVIEDVVTTGVWKAVRDALNYFSCRSGKIIITSRKKKAISLADSNLRRNPLNNDESWELFSKKLPLAEDPKTESKLKEEILKVCGGLPLRLVLLAGLLSTKEQTEWSRVIEIANEDDVDVFNLSYKDLPQQVKPCFLYMGLFPKEYEIPVRKLIHLWCAEGLVTTNSEEMVLEDLAQLYFQELVIRNMIQVRWRLDGSPKTCRMHDHLHHIFSQKAADVGFFHRDHFRSSHAPVKELTFAVRRLAADYLRIKNFISSFPELQHLRSCVVLDTRVRGVPASDICGFLNKIMVIRDFGLLTVLDLEGVYKPNFSDAVPKLPQLRYLGLRSTFIDSLPDSVDKLLHLETLDLKHTKIRKLPRSIWEGKKLQHLYLDWSHPGIVVDSSFSKSLSNLRTLWGLCIKDDSNVKYDFQGNFTGLRKLGLTCLSPSASKIITHLTQLQSLKLKDMGGLQLQSFEKHDKLQELYLRGPLEK